LTKGVISVRQNWVQRKLREGKTSWGAWLSLGDLHAAKILVRAGFDWLLIDLEHSPIDWNTASALVDTVAEAGAVPIIRVPEGNHHYIKRALDAGAWGIMVPMVHTAQQAKEAIAAAKFPPTGTRSVGSYLPMLSFDATTAEYVDRANDELMVVLQIESPQGIANLTEICQLPGCDVVFIGAFDLWQHLPLTDDGNRPPREELEAAIQQIMATARRFERPVGIFTLSPEDALRRQAQGMQMISSGTDASMLASKALHDAAQLSLIARGAVGMY